ncbi:MAG: hypothetical protein ACOCXG_03690 [Nanoarchaeota archaeon]
MEYRKVGIILFLLVLAIFAGCEGGSVRYMDANVPSGEGIKSPFGTLIYSGDEGRIFWCEDANCGSVQEKVFPKEIAYGEYFWTTTSGENLYRAFRGDYIPESDLTEYGVHSGELLDVTTPDNEHLDANFCPYGGTFGGQMTYTYGVIEEKCSKKESDIIGRNHCVRYDFWPALEQLDNLYYCHTTNDLIAGVKLPNHWDRQNDKIDLFCGDGNRISVEYYIPNTFFPEIEGAYKACIVKNINKNESVIFISETGNERLDERHETMGIDNNVHFFNENFTKIQNFFDLEYEDIDVNETITKNGTAFFSRPCSDTRMTDKYIDCDLDPNAVKSYVAGNIDKDAQITSVEEIVTIGARCGEDEDSPSFVDLGDDITMNCVVVETRRHYDGESEVIKKWKIYTNTFNVNYIINETIMKVNYTSQDDENEKYFVEYNSSQRVIVIKNFEEPLTQTIEDFEFIVPNYFGLSRIATFRKLSSDEFIYGYELPVVSFDPSIESLKPVYKIAFSGIEFKQDDCMKMLASRNVANKNNADYEENGALCENLANDGVKVYINSYAQTWEKDPYAPYNTFKNFIFDVLSK